MRARQDNPACLVVHPFEPVFDDRSRILILGTMPSRMSRQLGFYYGHPQNRFWPLLAELFEVPVPQDPDSKKALLLQHGIALWDVLRQCEIQGSQDSSIRQPAVNDLSWLLARCPIRQILANGQAAAGLYRQYCQPQTGRPCLALPSTSPANNRCSLEALLVSWRPALS